MPLSENEPDSRKNGETGRSHWENRLIPSENHLIPAENRLIIKTSPSDPAGSASRFPHIPSDETHGNVLRTCAKTLVFVHNVVSIT